jgi:GNAT superfamily N-acetyltransferase
LAVSVHDPRSWRGAGPPPPELEIVDATEASALLEAARLVNDIFGGETDPSALLQPQLVDDRFRVWLGTVDGRPVSSATAYVGNGFVGVYAVVTAPDARGHGYGEALTWAATMHRPDLPATLQASVMGLPLHERMGYGSVAEFTVWECPRV